MAFSINDLNYEKDSKERMPWEHYTEEFSKADPAEIAGRLSLPYDEEKKELTLKFLESVYYISWPDFQVTHEEDDAGFYPLEEMHWGEVYLRQFDGRCIKRLAFTYGNRLKDFKEIMEHIHAVPVDHGDIAYQVEIFPGYVVQMILWEGDDEFPPSSQILFSDNFPVSFAAEDMAVMGDVIIGSLKAFLKCL